MDIYLIRHGDALALGESGSTVDADRPLTALGQGQAHAVGKSLLDQGVSLDKVVTSPFLRARQTAEFILEELTPPPELHVCDDLVPEGKPRKVARFLRNLGPEQVGLVGHMPQLGLLAAWLIGGKKTQIELAKAGVAYISCGDKPRKGEGTLHWLVTPAWLAL